MTYPVQMYNAPLQGAPSATPIAPPHPVMQQSAHPAAGLLRLMNHRRVGLGIVYIVLSMIPFIGLATLAMAIAYGIKGNEVAAMSGRFYDDAQFVAVQNAWRNWGFGCMVVAVIIGVLGGIVGAVAGHST